ncbi:MAG: dicarboxylate/amino acid:cation symporter [Alphaproteobacteria bacterium]|nr:dicarboxylate/amino acid:cation symporter [Alphaproteobacteria bacterium]
MFRKMPFILMVVIIAIIILEPFMSWEMKSIIYGISLSIKSLIVFLLPLIIFGLLFKVASQLAHNATKVIVLILASVCLSNFFSTLLSYTVGSGVYYFDLSLVLPQNVQELEPYWTFELPKLIANDKAMFTALILGVISSLLQPRLAHKVSDLFEKITMKILSLFTILIPLFIAGFVVKLQFEGLIARIIEDYALIFLVIAISQFAYIGFIYMCVNRFKVKAFLKSLQNMLPATITGFSTMSSAAAMPLTILGAEQNAQDPTLVRSVIPATVNIHLIGDCFAIPIFAFAILKNYGIAEPSMISYVVFAFYFVLAKFSVAAVPGGGILVMLPILETHLGFNAEMMSLITALYILFDPVITSANVLGNGGFAQVMGKIILAFERFKPRPDFS